MAMAEVLTVARRGERADLHNASVNAALARAGYCGMVHLCSGRICVREAHHTGSCAFCARDEVEARTGVRPDTRESAR